MNMKQAFKKVMAVSMAAAFAVISLAACSKSSSSSSDEIVIGGLAPLTGSVSLYGKATTNGAQLAFKEINAAGGINGKQIKYVVLDEKGDAQEAITAYNRLRDQEKMVALLGDVTSTPSLAVAQRAVQDNIPMLTPTSTDAQVTLTGDNVFRICFIDPDQGTTMAKYASEKLGAKTAAIISNASDTYSVGLTKAFTEEAEALGLTITASETYGKDDKDFKSQLTKIQQTNPDVLYCPDYYETDILILSQAKEVGLNIPILGGDGWDGILNVTEEGNPQEADGVYFTNHFSESDTSEKVQNFIAAYKEEYDEDPVSFSALGYDAAYMLAEAIKNANSTDSDAITSALQSISYEGVTGSISFDENGDPIKPILIIKVDGGEYTVADKMEIER
ncbi:MAG: ABC transporter substrate-binding protein [Oscillospiraceae bacterium]|nr:ABC transporter substrate-binding protein [Oscillospiraceae bacterium]MDD4368015.1 ABC transporter substrate-binding protein [Oscillospiraceae bacterium]